MLCSSDEVVTLVAETDVKGAVFRLCLGSAFLFLNKRLCCFFSMEVLAGVPVEWGRGWWMLGISAIHTAGLCRVPLLLVCVCNFKLE